MGTVSIVPRIASNAAYCAIDVGLEVDWLCSLVSAWINASDRNLKANFVPVNSRDILEKVAELPITQWNYKSDANTAHLGPVAQDFRAAFGLGADDKSIATVDEGGVALAAIQGLNQKLEEQAETLKSKDARIHTLESRLADLEKAVARLAQTQRD